MEKKIIKNCLTERFLNEARGETGTPGITKTKEVQKQSDKINKAGLKAVEKNLKDADKLTSSSKSEPVKYNYNTPKEVEYHEQMEIMNGQEMIQYDRDPNDLFKEKAKEGIEGSSRMGNRAGKDTGNVEQTWDASEDNFGKELVKKIKASTKKRFDADDRLISFGDDIETVPKGQKPMAKHSALKEGRLIYEYNPYGSEKENDFYNDQPNKTQNQSPKPKTKTVKEEEVNEMDEGSFTAWCKNNGFKDGPSIACAKKAMGDDKSAAIHKKATFYMNTVQPKGKTTKDLEENNNNNKNPQIKESMKRLKFKNEFNGVGNALKLIPESYRTDNKVFEMTDGNESYKIRWEGTLTEGKAVVLMASDKTMVNEDMARMKHLMGYKSQDTLGTVKGAARLDENAIFNDIMNKSKLLVEGDNIEGKSAPKGEWDKISKKAPEATKHIEGSTSDDKGTKAPKAKQTTGEALDSAKKHAPEAKKHVEGGLKTGTSEIGMGLGVKSPEGEWEDISMPVAAANPGEPSKTTYAPAPSTGEWDKISVPHAQDAKKHVHMKEGIELGGIIYKPIKIVIESDLKKKG
jgi:hypothetical protein